MLDSDKSWRRLLKDGRGNVGFIAAASVVPLMAMVGGGLDVARGYMARTQLQSACDAGVLAGRKALSNASDYGEEEREKADKMFAFNFDQGTISASDVSFQTEANNTGEVTGTAQARVPNIVMRIFGQNNVDLTVTCAAELQMPNTDVMFVLDTTGSMGGSMGGSTRIEALRLAIRDFHSTMVNAVVDNRTRVRYGFVPYSTTVNPSDLFNDPDTPMPRDFFADSSPYETRVANFNTPELIGTTAVTNVREETITGDYSSTTCQKWGGNYGNNPVNTGIAPAPVTSLQYEYVGRSGKRPNRTCKRKVTTSVTTYDKVVFRFTNWRYMTANLDTSQFKTGANVQIGTNITNAWADAPGTFNLVELASENGNTVHDVGVSTTRWNNGCLEERETVQTNSFDPLPAGAFDLNLDLEPNSNATSWRPQWRDVSYWRTGNVEDTTNNNSLAPRPACPAPMRLLTRIDMLGDPNELPAWLDDYVENDLQPGGFTYHDIGMIWGGRLMSPTGIFADNVNLDSGTNSVGRHMIFMTDGVMENRNNIYDAYGVERMGNRVAPAGTGENGLEALHTARFLATCNAIKNRGINIWVIAFGTGLSADLQACASGNRAYMASNQEELRSRFQFIASQVADLRLSQ
ncbi:MAG: Tad domain-containing protein [Sphingomonadaceae bacterium]